MGDIAAYVVSTGIVVVWLFPLAWIVLTSFKSAPDIFSRVPLFSFEPTLANYIGIFSRPAFVEGLVNSLIAAGVTTLVAVGVGSFAAYALARLRFPWREQLVFSILSFRMMPAVVVVVPFYLTFYHLHLLDTLPGLIGAYLSFSLPFAIWMLVGFMKDIPKEMEDAALLDGCNHTQLLLRIVLPVMRPALAVVAIFTFMFCWNEFLLALMLTEADARTVPVVIIGLVQPDNLPWGELSAASIVTLIPMLTIVVALQRQIVRGLTMGAVR